MNEFIKAFNIVITLHEKTKKSLRIIADGESPDLGEESLGPKLRDQFNHIVSATRDLAKSRKLQFLSESQAAYAFLSRREKK